MRRFHILGDDGRERAPWSQRGCDAWPGGVTPDPEDGARAPAAPHRDLRVRKFADALDPVLEDAWLIKDVFPDQGFGAVYGAPGCGKTFMMLDLALAIAGGANEWRGRYVEHGAVLYFGMEGGRLFQNRLAAYAREKGQAPHFYISNENLDLRTTDADVAAIIAEALTIADHDRPVRLVVVDTLSRAMAGGNENSPEDMGSLIAACEAIRKALGCYIAVMHHSGKSEAQGLRGHSSLLGAVDTEVHFCDGVMTVGKQRDGVAGLSFGYSLRPVALGVTPRGEEVTSCVVDASDADEHKPEWRPTGNARIVWEALHEFAADHGVPNPGGTGWPEAGRFQTVETEAFRAFAQGRFTDSNPRQSFRRALAALQERGWVAANGGRIWSAKGAEHAEH